MKRIASKSTLTFTLAAGLLSSAVWSTAANACSSEPILTSVCIMATPKMDSFNNGYYVLANGAQLNVNQYQAVFSLIGNTYGGTYPTNFKLPDLRGRVVVGAGQGPGLPQYVPGQTGGAFAVQLTSAQLPPHVHTLTTPTPPSTAGVTVKSTLGTLAANTTLSGLTATTTLGSLTANTTIGTLAANTTLTGLTATLKAASGSASTSDATGNALPSVPGTAKPYLYTNAAPSINMNGSSIALNGSPSTTLSGSPATTLSGNPSTTVGGTAATSLAGAPGVTISGQTDVTGAGASIAIMPPYLAMNFYIAMQGLYPSWD